MVVLGIRRVPPGGDDVAGTLFEEKLPAARLDGGDPRFTATRVRTFDGAAVPDRTFCWCPEI